MSMNSGKRWQFRIRTLLILVAVFAILFTCYREIVGRLELEGPISTGRSPTIFFAVSHPDEIRRLNDTFDHNAFAAIVQRRLKGVAKQHQLDPIDFSVYVVDVDDAFCFNYDYARWGRSRFDVLQLRYVFDVADPVAQARNDAIEQAVFAASKDWAMTQQEVIRIEHHGRMHQIISKVP